MTKKKNIFAWAVVAVDVLFLLLTGDSLAYDYSHPHLWAIVLHLLLFSVWTYWFIRDTEKLRRR